MLSAQSTLTKRVLYAALCVFSVGIVACANMAAQTRTITAAQLQHKLDEKFATPIAALKLVGAQLTAPKVSFDTAAERIIVNFDMGFQNGLVGNISGGTAQLSGKLKYDEKTNSILLDQGTIDQIDLGFGNLRSFFIDEVRRSLVRSLSSEMLKDLPLYTLKPEDTTVAGIKFKPKSFKVTAQGLAVELAP